MSLPAPTVEWCGDHLRVIDQTRLPERVELLALRTTGDVVDAIRRLAVRGAPAIGVCGAFGVVIGLRERSPASMADLGPALAAVADRLATARPTAVNLAWAVSRTAAAARRGTTPAEAEDLALGEARRIEWADRESCRRIGEFGRRELAESTRILTHCNTGRLATAGWGTALGIVYAKARAGEPVEVYATETRPLLQGARLTAWELSEAGIPTTLLTDGSVGAAMASGRVQAVVVGCDRVAANGDTANKIGTYTCALAARANGLPFYVAGPVSSFDLTVASGEEIVIEVRDADEVRRVRDTPLAPPVEVWNPAFDVTPAGLITAFITDAGVLRPPFDVSIPRAMAAAEADGPRPEEPGG